MRLVVLLVALALPLAPTPRASAFELERVDNNPCGMSQNLFWPYATATLDLSPLPSFTFQTLANQAWQSWNVSVPAFHFRTGVGKGTCNLNDGLVTLALADKTCSGAAFGDILGFTVTNFNVKTGEMLDADVLFNSKALNPDAVFLQVAEHELGHVLGLDHSDACGTSGAGTLMKASLNFAGPRIDHPQADDVAGANFIYGSGSGGGPVMDSGTNGAMSCAIGNPEATNRSGLLLLLAPVLLLLARLRREATPRPRVP